jgi:hypothetical protein
VTEAEKIRALVRYRLEQATEALAAAELNLANGLARSAVNRAYYAMFYAVPRAAGFAPDRNVPAQRRDRAVRPGVRQARVVPPGVLAVAARRVPPPAGHYGAELAISNNEIETLLTHAREFLSGVRQYLETHPPPQV